MIRVKRASATGLLLLGFLGGSLPANGGTKPTPPDGHFSKPSTAVGAQYDTTHVYVSPEIVDNFVAAFLGTFGGKSTKQALVSVTPTASRTTSQLLQTPVGTVSLFGFVTPVPYPFGAERYGYLVKDLDVAVKAAREDGADLVVSPYKDPLGRDAIVRWPGGLTMQLYWHFTPPSYAPFSAAPDNRIYVSPDGAAKFIPSFLAFSRGAIVEDNRRAPGAEIGRPTEIYRRVRIKSDFGNALLLVTDGHLPYPYGRETTGYEVADLSSSLAKAASFGVKVLVPPYRAADREEAMVEFPGGYVAEMHSSVGVSH